MAQAPGQGWVADHKAVAGDDNVLVVLKGISDAHHFDEDAARRFVPALLDDGITPDEQDLFYELVTARTPVSVTSLDHHTFDVPPPDGAARDYLELLKAVLESKMLQQYFDSRWMAGAQPMKDIVDISTMGSSLNNMLTGYVARKLAPALKESNAANGFQPVKDEIAKIHGQIAMNDAATERNGKLLIAASLKTLERNAGVPVPLDIYQSLRP
jgi:hypothetical protein